MAATTGARWHHADVWGLLLMLAYHVVARSQLKIQSLGVRKIYIHPVLGHKSRRYSEGIYDMRAVLKTSCSTC